MNPTTEATEQPPPQDQVAETATTSDDAHAFASDNCSGAHPDILRAIAEANRGVAASYGLDAQSERLRHRVKENFGSRAEIYPVFNGTGANVVAIQAMTDRWGAVICASSAHLYLDECGAPEHTGGVKLLPIPALDGKLTPELVDAEAWGFDEVHRAQPQVLSISQSTEYGTTYSPDELRTLCAHAHDRGLSVHMDGARIANAAASLGVSLYALTAAVGVDVLSFGGTKNGLLLGDAVVVLNPERVAGIEYARKASTQLGSKLRFVAAQLNELLRDGLWLRNARRSNEMALRLASAVADLPGVSVTRPVQSNAVFAIVPPGVAHRLQERYAFPVWDARTREVRWMTSFDTSEHQVDSFAAAIRNEVTRAAA